MFKNNKYKYQLLIIEVIIYIFTLLTFLFVNKSLFFTNGFIDDKNSMGLYISIFSFTVIGLGLGIFYDIKYNHLKYKNIFLYLGIGIFILSLVSSLSLPSVVSLPNNSTMNITTSQRIYGILYGLMLGLLPYLFFYVVPRKLRHQNYIKFVVLLFIIYVSVSVIIGLFTDFNNYITTLKSGFQDMDHPCVSFYGWKNIYGRILFIGICSSIYMHILTKRKRWLFLIIPYFIANILSFSKMPILLSFIVVLFYFIYCFLPIVKKNKNNIYLSIYITCFILIMILIFSIMIAYSESGFLFRIKKVFNSIFESINKTFNSRLIIWDCTFKLIKPIQYIFGFGFTFVGNAIHIVYTNDPRCLEDTSHIWTAHNSYIEMIAQGGIIYLLMNAIMLFFIIYASIKIYKINRKLSVMNVFILFIILIQGITDAVMFFGEGDNVFFSALVGLPVLGMYYNLVDKNEIKNKEEIITTSYEIEKISFNSKLLNLNKKRIIFERKNIEKDILNK